MRFILSLPGARSSRFPADNPEGTSHILRDFSKLRPQCRLLGIDYNVYTRPKPLPFASHSFPQAPLNAVALYRPTQHTSNSESNPRAASRPRQEEKGHVAGKMPLPLLVDALEIRMPQQSRYPGKSCPSPPAGGLSSRSLLFRRRAVHGCFSACVNSGHACAVQVVIRGSPALPKPAYVLWRDGAPGPPARSSSSSVGESRAFSSGGDGWAGTCVWAWKKLAAPCG